MSERSRDIWTQSVASEASARHNPAMDFEQRYRVPVDGFELSNRRTSDRDLLSKAEAHVIRERDIQRLDDLQERLYAEGKRSLLVILQALDAGGKDSTIEHVMSGVNPQGVRVTSFKPPSHAELAHDFLWRCQIALPRAGEIGIFNRSHYEEVLVVRVHPELLAERGVDPGAGEKEDFWKRRMDDIVAWERHLHRSGTHIVKLFLHISAGEQHARLLARAREPKKHWKFAPQDAVEHKLYAEYQRVYEQMLQETSTDFAPWYVIPADEKWLLRTAVASIIVGRLEELNPRFPELSESQRVEMRRALEALEAESAARPHGQGDG